MLNTFDEKAEQVSLAAKYMIDAQCACDWKGNQAQLSQTNTKDRACPSCGAAFKRAHIAIRGAG